MSDRELWRIYGSQPAPKTFRSKREARRLARKYRRLGITVSTYTSADGETWRPADRATACLGSATLTVGTTRGEGDQQ
jgi:hypothetical protein